MSLSAEVTAQLLARGFEDIYARILEDGAVVQQDASLPPSARRALARLSRMCLEAGREDIGSSIHLTMSMAAEPLASWGLPQFDPPFAFADAILIDRDLGVPTPDCRELSRAGGSEIAAEEELHHEQLRAVLQSYPTSRRAKAYTELREIVVRRPVIRARDLQSFLVERDHALSAHLLTNLYRPIPASALFAGRAHICGGCGGLLWPDSTGILATGRCRVRQCCADGGGLSLREKIEDPEQWRVAHNAILAFWVGPGLDEIRIADALSAAGRAVTLYPHQDAADVGVDGLRVGIDVKAYASPLALAQRLTRGVGRLELFGRRIIAVPDYKLRLNPHYLRQLSESYAGSVSVEFMTSSDAVKALVT